MARSKNEQSGRRDNIGLCNTWVLIEVIGLTGPLVRDGQHLGIAICLRIFLMRARSLSKVGVGLLHTAHAQANQLVPSFVVQYGTACLPLYKARSSFETVSPTIL
jgi:hypothetical protein